MQTRSMRAIADCDVRERERASVRERAIIYFHIERAACMCVRAMTSFIWNNLTILHLILMPLCLCV